MSRVVCAIVLVLALLFVMGCGESDSATPHPTPTATSYADATALFKAIEQAGSQRLEGPRVEGLKTGRFASEAIPKSAHATRANFMVAVSDGTLTLSDGTPATVAVAALLPDSASVPAARAYGAHMAGALGYPSIWQLEGPNWLIWSVERDAIRLLQSAIGGAVTETPTQA